MSRLDKLPPELIHYIEEFKGYDYQADYIKNILEKSIDYDKVNAFFKDEEGCEIYNDEDKKIVMKYLKHSLMCHITFRFQNKIITEFYTKKGKLKRDLYKANSKDDQKFIIKYLFFNKKVISTFTPIISSLEDIGCKCLFYEFKSRKYSKILGSIYFTNKNDRFLKGNWEIKLPNVLSDDLILNEYDKKEIINVYYWYKYNYEYLCNCIKHLEIEDRKDYKNILKHINKVINEN